MDAVKFIEECRRMCRVTGKYPPALSERISPEEVVKTVEDWSAAHPRKTRQYVFLEQYPYAERIEGILVFCPKAIDTCFSCPIGNVDCATCKYEFWNQEVE